VWRGRGRSLLVGRGDGGATGGGARVFSAAAAAASEAPRGTGGVRAPRPDRDTGALTTAITAAAITFTRRRGGPTVDLGASRRYLSSGRRRRRHRHRRRRPVPVVGRDGFLFSFFSASARPGHH